MTSEGPTEVLGELRNISHQLASQSASQIIEKFRGDKSRLKAWLRSVEKESKLTVDSDETKIRLAYQTSDDIACSFIARHIKENERTTWAQLKTALTTVFGDGSDNSHALAQLKQLKQKSNENTQIFARRILKLAEDAFQGHNLEADLIQRQLTDMFLDGLQNHSIAKKIVRDCPTNFQRLFK